MRAVAIALLLSPMLAACASSPSPEVAAARGPATNDPGSPISSAALSLRDSLAPTDVGEPTAAFDESTGRWLVADYEEEPGERPSLRFFGFVGDEGEVVVDERPLTDLRPCANLVSEASRTAYAMGGLVPLVRLEERLLYITADPSGHARAFLVDPSDGSLVRLGEKSFPDALHPASCPGLADCALPFTVSLHSVQRSPDRSSLLLQGTAGPPDHPASGPWHWRIAVDPSLTL